MDYQKKYRWAVTGLLVMILLNVVTLLTIWLNKPDYSEWIHNRDEDRGHNGVHQFMQKELGLSSAQMDSIAALRRTHFRELRTMKRNLEQMRRNYFDMLMNPETEFDISRDSLVQNMAGQYIAIEKSMHRHMSEMKSVLNEDQQQKFERLMKNTLMKQGDRERERRNRMNHN